MKSFFSGCFGFIALMFALVFFINNPAVFWGVVVVFGVMVLLGVREGLKRSRAKMAQNPPTTPATSTDDEEEGDIRHHYDIGGTPMSISNPETIQNESMSFGDDEDAHH
jgi:hypothetical protein